MSLTNEQPYTGVLPLTVLPWLLPGSAGGTGCNSNGAVNGGTVEPGHWLECLVFEGASTLLGRRPDLASQYVCRVIQHLDRKGLRYAMPRNDDPSVSA